MVIGGEYGTGTIRVTLAAMPRRLPVLAAKAVIVTGCALAAGAAAVLGLLYLFPIVTAVLPDHTFARHLDQASPMIAGLYIQATVGLQDLPLAPWQGLGVPAAWAAGALIPGGALLRLRDA